MQITFDKFEYIRERFRHGEFAISDHAITEARKDGVDPETISKLRWIVNNGKVIEIYPERQRILIYGELPENSLPVHIAVDYSLLEEPVIITAYIPESRMWTKSQIRKPIQKRKK